MNRQKIAAGPGASSLILIAVMLSLTILAALTMISARNDESLSDRSVETARQIYELSARGEASLAKLDQVLNEARRTAGDDTEYLTALADSLPEGMRLEEDQVFWTEQSEDRHINCGVRVLPMSENRRYEWTLHSIRPGAQEEESEWEDDWN